MQPVVLTAIKNVFVTICKFFFVPVECYTIILILIVFVMYLGDRFVHRVNKGARTSSAISPFFSPCFFCVTFLAGGL